MSLYWLHVVTCGYRGEVGRVKDNLPGGGDKGVEARAARGP